MGDDDHGDNDNDNQDNASDDGHVAVVILTL